VKLVLQDLLGILKKDKIYEPWLKKDPALETTPPAQD
jgi:hypothetical protein